MSKKTKYYIKEPLKPRLRITNFIAFWLLLDRLNAPQWLWGIYWFVTATLFITLVYLMLKDETDEVDIQSLLRKQAFDEINLKSRSPE